MRRFIPFAFAVLFVFAAMPLHAAGIGEPAPDFTAPDTNGKTVTLSALKGKIVVLEWTNHDCPFVKKHYGSGNMQALQKKAAADHVVWISVISSAPGHQGHVSDEQANEIAAERGASPAHIIRDESGEIGRMYYARTTPHMFVIDKGGMLVYAGAIDSIRSTDQDDIAKAENYVTAALDALKADKQVATASTQSYGCSVKY
ncbi:MAG: redoxin domain-containing protein [Alphaproteobacteria bacterium]|nr:redoxin domain-containing protein [Alphaproteobacteria bacterium]